VLGFAALTPTYGLDTCSRINNTKIILKKRNRIEFSYFSFTFLHSDPGFAGFQNHFVTSIAQPTKIQNNKIVAATIVNMEIEKNLYTLCF